jgi:hypothetical protein
MKTKLAILTMACITTLLFACRKENRIGNTHLYGKWILTEVYDPYAYGGSSFWHTVSNDQSHYLQFTSTGEFKKIENSGGAFQQCSGTYRLSSENRLEVNSSCPTLVEKMTISELTIQSLIIDVIGTEGVIRYKYKADK